MYIIYNCLVEVFFFKIIKIKSDLSPYILFPTGINYILIRIHYPERHDRWLRFLSSVGPGGSF